MGYSSGQVKKEVLKRFLEPWDTPELEEEVQAGSDSIPATTTTPQKVAEGSVPAGYDGVLMGIACTQSAVCAAYFQRAKKQVYSNGLNTNGLAGLTRETALYAKLREKQAWELGFTNTSGGDVTINWRIRVRYIKKG